MDPQAVAHGIHYGIVAAGVVGVLALIVPVHVPARVRAPRDQHEARVLLLRAEIASGSLGTRAPDGRPSAPASPAQPEPDLPHGARVLLPAAFVGSAAAAGVHAAMAPGHLSHSALVGGFFVVAALTQVSWAAALVAGCTRGLLVAGAALNAAFVALWALSRTLGVPGVAPDPEPVGPWDLTCVAWQLVVVSACVRLLARARPVEPLPARLAPWHRWDGRVVLLAVVSTAALAALSFSGSGG